MRLSGRYPTSDFSISWERWIWVEEFPHRICAGDVNLSIDLRDEARGERFAICCRPHHGNREGLAFLSVSMRRTQTRPSSWRRLDDLSPIRRIRQGPPALHHLSSYLAPLLTPPLRLEAQGRVYFPSAIFLWRGYGSRIFSQNLRGTTPGERREVVGERNNAK